MIGRRPFYLVGLLSVGALLDLPGTIGMSSAGADQAAVRPAVRSDGGPGREPGGSSLIAVGRGPDRQLRVSADGTAFEAALTAARPLEAAHPTGEPDWEVTLFRGSEQRTYELWEDPAVIAEWQDGGSSRYRTGTDLVRLVRQMSQGIDPKGISPEKGSEIAAMPKIEGSFPSLGGLATGSGHVFLGRIVGVSDHRFERETREQWVSYVVLVAEELKSSQPRPMRHVRFRWPVGRYSPFSCSGRRYPPLSVGGDYIFFTLPSPRYVRAADGSWRLENHGEETIVTRGWPASVGLGIVRVRNRVVVPPFEELEREVAERAAAGVPVPTLQTGPGFSGIPAWGLSLPEYLRYLRPIAAAYGQRPRRE